MKKLVNEPEDLVLESLEGFAAAHADVVRLHRDPVYVTRAGGTPSGTVAVVSGGGSGHEPLHVGMVGRGMLAAAVPGRVFTSPTPDQIAAALVAADAGAGVLTVVKNYTGDVLSFELAAELAAEQGVEVASVLVDDDVAVLDPAEGAGRRGVAGTVVVEKLAGAAAERGGDLASVHAVATRAVAATRSLGLALEACTVPHVGRRSFDLGPGEVELGVGIHGEPGRRRIPLAPADRLTADLLEPVAADLALQDGDRVLLLVNGLGGTPPAELQVVHRAARRLLETRGVVVARVLVGDYVTSLDMQGVSLTLTRLDAELLALWDETVHTSALSW